jgi:hypothetical protein
MDALAYILFFTLKYYLDKGAKARHRSVKVIDG